MTKKKTPKQIKKIVKKKEKIVKITFQEQQEAYIKVCVATRRYYWEYKPSPFMVKDGNNPRHLGDSVIKNHIKGMMKEGHITCLGLPPFIDNENVLNGGIDLDAHGYTKKQKESKLKELGGDKDKLKKDEDKFKEPQRKQIKQDLPLICKELDKLGYLYFLNSSGSEGIHIRIYGNKPTNARVMRYMLKDLQARLLGDCDRHEVFPKQDELNEEHPFGNQMKGVLAIHPKTNKLAGIIKEGKVLDREQSLNYIVDFAKQIPKAKPIDFKVTEEIKKKYEKKPIVLSEAERIKINDKNIPYYCGSMELGEEHIFPRPMHDSGIDRQAYLYYQDKPKKFDRWKEMQGREDSAFNGADKGVWFCTVQQKYYRKNKDNEAAKKCIKACMGCVHCYNLYIPDLKPLIQNLENPEKKNRIIQDILKSKINAEALEFDEVIDQINEVTDIDKVTLRKQFKQESDKVLKADKISQLKKVKADKIKPYISQKHDLREDKLGYLFTKDGFYKDTPMTFELAAFDKIQKQKQIVYDMTTGKIKKQLEFYMEIKGKVYTSKNDIEIKNNLWLGKRPSQKSLYREDEFAFIERINRFSDTIIKKSNCYGFTQEYGYIDYPEYKLYNTTFEKLGSDILRKEEFTSISDNYKDFMDLKVDDKKVEMIIEHLNKKIPRSEGEKRHYKLIFSWSIASALKKVLISKGYNLHPFVIGVGNRRLGKSTAMELGISYLWNTPILTPAHFEGSAGARLKQLDNNLFPIYCDELVSLDKWAEILKQAMVKGYLKIPRGKKDGSFEEHIKFFNLGISANKYKTSDPALKDRFIIYSHNISNITPIITDKELKWLNDNIIHLGKKIYMSFGDYNFDKVFDELEKKLSKYEGRDKFKMGYILLGSKILDDIGLFKDVDVSEDVILGTAEGVTLSLKDQIKDVVKLIVNNIQRWRQPYTEGEYGEDGYKKVSGKMQTVGRCLEEGMIDSEFTVELKAKGVYLCKDFNGIIITANMLPLINDKLKSTQLNEEFKTLRELAERGLDTKCKPHKTEMTNDSTIRGIKILEKEDIVSVESEDENV